MGEEIMVDEDTRAVRAVDQAVVVRAFGMPRRA
jgi:hypothetical protein